MDICNLFNVSRSNYYTWRNQISERKIFCQQNKKVMKLIESIFIRSRKSYGAIRVHNWLVKIGISNYSVKQVRHLVLSPPICSANRPLRGLVKGNGLFSVHCRKKRRVVCTTDSRGNELIVGNLLSRDFVATAPNKKWVGDITYVSTDEGWLYLASVMELFSRKIIGYAMSDCIDAQLACAAFKMALLRRPQARELVYHSDRGSVYGSIAFRELLIKNNITPSMSRKGNCYAFAVAESFFHTIKVELIYENHYKLRVSAI